MSGGKDGFSYNQLNFLCTALGLTGEEGNYANLQKFSNLKEFFFDKEDLLIKHAVDKISRGASIKERKLEVKDQNVNSIKQDIVAAFFHKYDEELKTLALKVIEKHILENKKIPKSNESVFNLMFGLSTPFMTNALYDLGKKTDSEKKSDTDPVSKDISSYFKKLEENIGTLIFKPKDGIGKKDLKVDDKLLSAKLKDLIVTAFYCTEHKDEPLLVLAELMVFNKRSRENSNVYTSDGRDTGRAGFVTILEGLTSGESLPNDLDFLRSLAKRIEPEEKNPPQLNKENFEVFFEQVQKKYPNINVSNKNLEGPTDKNVPIKPGNSWEIKIKNEKYEINSNGPTL